MDTLTVNKQNVHEAYDEANNKGRSLLERLFGKKEFQGSIIERVNGFEDGARETGKCTLEIAMINNIPDKYHRAQVRIETVAEALREGKPASECFYYPWFNVGSGGFSFFDAGYVSSCSNVGARLRVDTAEKARHLGKIMLDDYKTYITGK